MDGRLLPLLTHAAAAAGGALLALRFHSSAATASPLIEEPPPLEEAHLDCSRANLEAVAWEGKNEMVRPCHSHFRVYAVVVYERPDGKPAYITGTNCEYSPYIGGALCAERVALSKLCEIPHKRVLEVHIVSDSPQYLTPGTLCREFMSGYLDPATPIHMIGTESRLTASLAQLHPFPSIYASVDRARVLAFAQEFAAQMEVPASAQERDLYAAARRVTEFDNTDAIYPMRYAAGVLFDDGSIEVGWQVKAMEYGSTLDAVTKLLHTIQICGMADPPRTPQLLMHMDHCGVLHAPFAQARALLCEHGLGMVPCLLHDASGRLRTVTLQELLPEGCNIF